jgi:hypothetical protein
MLPLVGRSIAPSKFSIVVLPLPDGPDSTVNRPDAMSTETSRTAATAVSPAP